LKDGGVLLGKYWRQSEKEVSVAKAVVAANPSRKCAPYWMSL